MSEKKVSHFEIVLNKPKNRAYVPGEAISGTVQLQVCERLKVNSIKLTLQGKVMIQW